MMLVALASASNIGWPGGHIERCMLAHTNMPVCVCFEYNFLCITLECWRMHGWVGGMVVVEEVNGSETGSE